MRVTTRTWPRFLLAGVLILIWLIGAGVGGPYFGRVSEVSSNERTAYLPESADATRVQELLGEFTDSEDIPAVVVVAGDSELTPEQIAAVGTALGNLPGSSPPIPSADGRAVEAFVPLSASGDVGAAVTQLSTTLDDATAAWPGVSTWVTGPAGFSADLGAAFSGIDGLLLLVAVGAVFIILIAVYRSLLLPVAVLATSLFALTVALLSVWWLARAGVVLLSGQTQGILFILVIGAATDYSLLYVSRFREELRVHTDRWAATTGAIRGSIEPILASGATVIAGLLCLLLSDLKSNSTLGPVASIGIVFAMASALTLLPSLLFLFGRAAFWPRRPKYEPDVVRREGGVPTHGVWARVAGLVHRRPRAIWVSTLLLLLGAAAFVPQLQASGVSQSDLVLGSSEAREGQEVLGRHFPGGSGSPVYVIVGAQDAPAATAVIGGNDSFGDLGTAQGQVDGQVLVQATLTDAADSPAAENAVRGLRQGFADEGIDAMVGGVTATAIDTDDASTHDRTLIIPVVLLVILGILMLLLRSVLAPLLLVATTVVSFAAALGVSALMFNHVFGFPGADPAVPLYGFVFLVALGIDYNIFLATRIREESLRHGTRTGIIRGLTVTGGVITSAGIVLAATFAALSVIPLLFLVQIAFIVAFGVLVDTFLVRAFLVPALFHDIGPGIWWPSRLWKERK
ncbi:MMPL family transporter [Corynebacterium pacaense]|uniref:MMPL family transporter n=1 Tax=Corynebacterium pacaense TaxID=1816684 RepID=UPI0009BA5B1C|nr:MMPL family transporter [Corynebacterium pacaense]